MSNPKKQILKYTDDIAKMSDYSAMTRMVWTFLAKRAREDGSVWHSKKRIAEAVGCSLSTVKRAIGMLEGDGEKGPISKRKLNPGDKLPSGRKTRRARNLYVVDYTFFCHGVTPNCKQDGPNIGVQKGPDMYEEKISEEKKISEEILETHMRAEQKRLEIDLEDRTSQPMQISDVPLLSSLRGESCFSGERLESSASNNLVLDLFVSGVRKRVPGYRCPPVTKWQAERLREVEQTWDSDVLAKMLGKICERWEDNFPYQIRTRAYPVVPTLDLMLKNCELLLNDVGCEGMGDMRNDLETKWRGKKIANERLRHDLKRCSVYCSHLDCTAFSLGEILRVVREAKSERLPLPRNLQKFYSCLQSRGCGIVSGLGTSDVEILDAGRRTSEEWMQRMQG